VQRERQISVTSISYRGGMKELVMADRDAADQVPHLSQRDRVALVLGYWRRGELTPLPIANSLARPAAPRPSAAR
jgi:hypothetical protein